MDRPKNKSVTPEEAKAHLRQSAARTQVSSYAELLKQLAQTTVPEQPALAATLFCAAGFLLGVSPHLRKSLVDALRTGLANEKLVEQALAMYMDAKLRK